MQTLKFDFQHPVKGVIRFLPIDSGSCLHQRFECDGSATLEIEVGHLKKGKWRAELDWECDDRLYAVKTEFAVDGLADDTSV